MATKRPLDGIKVLDLSRVLAGPLCTQYLGDMGADVIKVEDVGGGDEMRSWPEFREGADGLRTSAPFLSVNRNKRSIAIDLKTSVGKDLLLKLAASADIVVESFAPGVAERLGIGADTLRAIHPALIYCSISGFGSSGPLSHGKGYDLILQAFSGMLSITGDAGSAPMRSPFSPVDQGTGLHALIGILAALYARTSTAQGCTVEASLFDTSTAFLGYFLQNHWETQTEPVKAGVGHRGLCPYGMFEAQDKPLIIAVANDKLWQKFCAVAGLAGRPDLAAFGTNESRVANRNEVEAIVGQALRLHKRSHWFSALDDAGIPCSPVHTLGEFAAHPHTTASGMRYQYQDSTFGVIESVAQPLRFDGLRLPQYRNPPLHGEHTQEILGELGLNTSDITQLANSGFIKMANGKA